MVKRTPDWANGNRGEQWVPTRLRDYSDFLVAVARHYPTVRHWMVWGEPTRGDSFKPMPRQLAARSRGCTRGCSTRPTARSRACGARTS